MDENELNEQLNSAGHQVADGREDDEPEVIDEVDEPEEIEASDEEPEHDEPAPQAQSKADKSGRFQTLANERTAAKAEAALQKQQNDLLRQQLEQMQRAQQEKADENLDPDEKWRRDANRAIQQVQFQASEANDKAAFMSTVSNDPVLGKHREAVEQKLREFRNQNINMPRDAVLTIVMGEAAREAAKKVPAAKREGRDRVSAARGQPLGSKSNVAPSKSTANSSYERLKDQLI